MTLPYGFRIVGDTAGERRLIDAGAALSAYAACHEFAEVNREAYLSAFAFGEDFRGLLESTGSVRGFSGACWSAFLWFDIDRADLDAALVDARRLAVTLDERFQLGEDDLLVFFSGSKGFHIGVPTALWTPAPAGEFHRIARRFAERIGEVAAVAIDTGVYDAVRAFRAPNSRHPKTGLHKRRLTLDELRHLSLDAIRRLAERPELFDLPTPAARSDQAATDWLDAERSVRDQAEGKARRRAASDGTPTLNRSTLDFIRDGAGEGDRHRLLFSAAANLAEFGCPSALALALLAEPAPDSGLPPSDVRRQIDCGLSHAAPSTLDAAGPAPSPPDAAGPAPSPLAPSTANKDQLQADLAALWATPTTPPADSVHLDGDQADANAHERAAIAWEGTLRNPEAQTVADAAIAEFERANDLPPSKPTSLFPNAQGRDHYTERL